MDPGYAICRKYFDDQIYLQLIYFPPPSPPIFSILIVTLGFHVCCFLVVYDDIALLRKNISFVRTMINLIANKLVRFIKRPTLKQSSKVTY